MAEVPTPVRRGSRVGSSSQFYTKSPFCSGVSQIASSPSCPEMPAGGPFLPCGSLDPGLCSDILPFLLTDPQTTRASTMVPEATTTSSRKDRRPRRPRRQWTYPLCHHLGLRGRRWEVWTTRCLATTLPARRSDSPTSSHIPQGTRLVLSPACRGLSIPCQRRSSGPAHPSHLCPSTAGPATGTTCPILLK